MKRPFKKRLYIKFMRTMRHFNARTPSAPMVTVGPKVVVIGGGTGLSTMLRGLKNHTKNITAIVTVADDGGGSGMLREELGMLPPGDIRNCITALANAEPTMMELLHYRFTEGPYKGQSFGNLFLAALNGICGSFEEAVARMNEVLAVTGRVLPVTTSDVNLEAVFEDGSTIIGESKIASHKKSVGCRIKRVALKPEHPTALPHALEAIAAADLIVLGPGSLYTSVIPNLLVDGITQALEQAHAMKVYVLNIMTQDGETEGYTAIDHAHALMLHSSEKILDACIYNTARVPEKLLEKYRTEDSEPVEVEKDRAAFEKAGIELCGFPLISESSEFARHDPELLASAIMEFFTQRSIREGVPGAYNQLILHKEKT